MSDNSKDLTIKKEAGKELKSLDSLTVTPRKEGLVIG
jgi:hypothetical protein